MNLRGWLAFLTDHTHFPLPRSCRKNFALTDLDKILKVLFYLIVWGIGKCLWWSNLILNSASA